MACSLGKHFCLWVYLSKEVFPGCFGGSGCQIELRVLQWREVLGDEHFQIISSSKALLTKEEIVEIE